MRYRFMRFPNGKTKALTLSYDDGKPTDKKLVEVINKYGIKCTFNICNSHIGGGNLSEDEIRDIILAQGHEVANHGERHVALGMVDAKDGLNDMLEGRRGLEQRFSKIIKGMAYPDTNRKLVTQYDEIKAYLQALGIVYGRTAGNPNNEFRMPADWHAWEPTCHHNHPKLLEWLEEFKLLDPDTCYCCSRDPRIFYLWGHSREFDCDNNWDVIEEFCKRASDSDDIWFATNIEIYEYTKAYESLEFSFDNTMVYNPSLYEIWFKYDDRDFVVQPGEQIIL